MITNEDTTIPAICSNPESQKKTKNRLLMRAPAVWHTAAHFPLCSSFFSHTWKLAKIQWKTSISLLQLKANVMNGSFCHQASWLRQSETTSKHTHTHWHTQTQAWGPELSIWLWLWCDWPICWRIDWHIDWLMMSLISLREVCHHSYRSSPAPVLLRSPTQISRTSPVLKRFCRLTSQQVER